MMTSQIYGLYDPLRLLSPITIKYKLLLQKLTLRGLTWDAILPDDLMEKARGVPKKIVLNLRIVSVRFTDP